MQPDAVADAPPRATTPRRAAIVGELCFEDVASGLGRGSMHSGARRCVRVRVARQNLYAVPASPSSPRSDTGPPGVPLDTLLAAAEQAGWLVTLKQAVSAHGGPNPTRVDLRRGPLLVKLLVYSWYITLEGKGRKKDDFRIQTTRTHDGPLRSERGRITIGVGWRGEGRRLRPFDRRGKHHHGSPSRLHPRPAVL